MASSNHTYMTLHMLNKALEASLLLVAKDDDTLSLVGSGMLILLQEIAALRTELHMEVPDGLK